MNTWWKIDLCKYEQALISSKTSARQTLFSTDFKISISLSLTESLKIFLTFLEELSTPEGKWQWKIHCKFQKKLKELGR